MRRNIALTAIKLDDFHLFCGAVNVDNSMKSSFLVGDVFGARALIFTIDYEMHFSFVFVAQRWHKYHSDS